MTAFRAKPNATENVSVSSSNQVATVDFSGCSTIRVKNSGTADVFIRFGATNGVAATTTDDMPIGPGVVEVLDPGAEMAALYVGVIAAGSTGTIYFTPGNGI